MPEKLSPSDLDKQLASLKGWEKIEDREAIGKEFKFKDFNAAFSFMTQSALLAEKMGHHPEWLNVYNRVAVTLSTHDAGGVTDLDIQMATAMELYSSP